MEFLGHSLAKPATTLPGEFYTSAEIFAQEQDRIFARRWICVGRANVLAEPGDFELARGRR